MKRERERETVSEREGEGQGERGERERERLKREKTGGFGTNVQFEIFLQSHHCSTNRLEHVYSSDLGAVVCKSCATHQALITCNMSYYVPRDMKGKLSY